MEIVKKIPYHVEHQWVLTTALICLGMESRHNVYFIMHISDNSLWDISFGGDYGSDVSATIARLAAKDFSNVIVCRQKTQHSSFVSFEIFRTLHSLFFKDKCYYSQCHLANCSRTAYLGVQITQHQKL